MMNFIKYILLILSIFNIKTALADLTYPTRAIHLIVPYAPGGSSDIIARIIAPELTVKLGQTIVIENQSGAAGTIGLQKVVNSKADGYTILLGSGSEILINKLINSKLPDGQKDLKPVIFGGTGDMVLIGKKSLPVNNIEELINYAKNNHLSFASAGNGSPMHLAGELLNIKAKTQITHVPYKGASPGLQNIAGGNIDLGIYTLSATNSFIKSKSVKVFGIIDSKTSVLAPEIPAIGQVKGLEEVKLNAWFGLFVPTKTNDEIVSKLEIVLKDIFTNSEIIKKLADNGIISLGKSAEEFQKFMNLENKKYQEIINQLELNLN